MFVFVCLVSVQAWGWCNFRVKWNMNHVCAWNKQKQIINDLIHFLHSNSTPRLKQNGLFQKDMPTFWTVEKKLVIIEMSLRTQKFSIAFVFSIQQLYFGLCNLYTFLLRNHIRVKMTSVTGPYCVYHYPVVGLRHYLVITSLLYKLKFKWQHTSLCAAFCLGSYVTK